MPNIQTKTKNHEIKQENMIDNKKNYKWKQTQKRKKIIELAIKNIKYYYKPIDLSNINVSYYIMNLL